MYVDDGEITDLQEAKGEGQAVVEDYFHLTGADLSMERRTAMCAQSSFLGVASDSSTLFEGYTACWPMEHIVAALQTMHKAFWKGGVCSPAAASKYRGIAGVAATADYGSLLKAAVGPFKQGQCSDVPPWQLSKTIKRAIDYVEMILRMKPVRRMHVVPSDLPPLVIATDAQVEKGSPPGCGALLYDPATGAKLGFWVVFTDSLLAPSGLSQAEIDASRQPIALCEGGDGAIRCGALAKEDRRQT
jgi:hypothetical protein